MTKEFEGGAAIAWGIVLGGKVREPLTTLRSVAEGWKAHGYEVVGLRAVSATAAATLLTSQSEATTRNEDARDAARYRKLQGWMSSNVDEGWSKVCELAAIACYLEWDAFDKYLDELPECVLGLMSPSPTKAVQG